MGLLDFLKTRRPEDRFAERAIRRLRERGWPHAVTYNAADFSLDAGAGAGVLYLGNIFTDWRTYPKAQQAEQLDRALNLVFELTLEMPFEDAADRLMPVVRNLMHLQATALSSEEKPSTELWQPYRTLVAPLGVLVAIDQPTSVAMISHDMLQKWGVSFDAALERAMENLVPLSPVKFEPTEGGFHLSAYEDAYHSSRVLMPELFPAIQVRGNPVAVVISRTCVAVAGSLETEALIAMAHFAVDAVADETRPTSCLPIVLRDGVWEPFEPEAEELAPLRDLALRQAFLDYNGQAPMLEAYLAHKGLDAFVAPLEVTEADDGAHSWTSWIEDVPALLPRADALALKTGDDRRLIRRWADVEAVCGRFDADTSLHPTRFTPPAWPSDDAWRRLESEFSEPTWLSFNAS